MFVSIDWLSFTLPTAGGQEVLAFELWGRVAKDMELATPLAYLAFVKDWQYTPRPGRAPYNQAQQRDDKGVMIYAHQRIDHSLVEVGGIGMDALGSLDAEIAVMKAVGHRLTRIDIAVDIFTEVRPDEFSQARNTERFTSWSEAVSESGHTVYIGSKTSDRYARVYRYNDPHPRSQFLRVEHVLKAEQAKAAAEAIEEIGIEAFVAMLGNTFGWAHEVWTPAVDTEEAVKAWRPERRQGKTVSWMYGTVFPSLRSLILDGAMGADDVHKWFREHGVDL